MQNTETAVTGEKRFSSNETSLDKPAFDLLPTGNYELKILGEKVSVSAPSQANADGVPYIKCQFEVLGSAKKEGGKNQKLFPMFFLTTRPTKEGSNWVAVKARGSVTDLAKSVQENLDVAVIDFTTMSGKTVEILYPLEVAEWLRQRDGMVVKAHVKQEKGGAYTDSSGEEKTRQDSNKIAYFILG